MKVLYIGWNKKRKRSLPVNRLKSGTATLAAVAIMMIAAVIGGRMSSSLPASAKVSEPTVYVLSYRPSDHVDALALLENDIGYIRSMGLGFVLPRALNALTENAVMLVIEDPSLAAAAVPLLQKQDACAVVTAESPAPNEAEMRSLFSLDIIEPAGIIGDKADTVDLAAEISEAKIEFAAEYGLECSCFVHACSNIICNDRFDELKDIDTGTIFVFGNGKNTINEKRQGTRVLERIVRLPEWTIEEYFKDIAL